MYQKVYEYVEIQVEELKRLGAADDLMRNGHQKAPSFVFRLRESGGNALIAFGKRLKPQRRVGQTQYIATPHSALRSR